MSNNNNNSNSNNGNGQPPKKLSDEAIIFNTFALIIRNKFSPTPASPTEHDHSAQTTEARIKRLDSLYNGPAYQVEKAKLTKMNNNGMVYGLACGLLTFGILRGGPKFIQRTLMRRHAIQQQQRNTTGYTFDHQAAASNDMNMNFKAPKPGLLYRTIKLGLDLFVSTSMALYGSAAMTDMAEIPLVEGRSLIADELCDDFIDVYRGIPRKTWKKYEGKSEALDAISGFVMNCMRRKVVENEIMEQNRSFGMADSHDEDGGKAASPRSSGDELHPEIPSPGISRDMHVEIQFGDKSEDLQVGRELESGDADDFSEFDIYGTGFGDGADSMTRDDTDGDRREK
jgi:hypothetical protein